MSNYDFKFNKRPAIGESAFNHYSEIVEQLVDLASIENVYEIKMAADVKQLFAVNSHFNSNNTYRTAESIAAEVESKGVYEAGTFLDTLHIMISPYLKPGEVEIGKQKGIVGNF